jgi:hypothetical protein
MARPGIKLASATGWMAGLAMLAEVLDAFEEKGIGGVTAMGYSRSTPTAW